MNNILIDNWNSAIKNNDRIFMLGDFCLAGKDKIVEIGNKLNGRKTLIIGNHDEAALSTYYKAGFEIVSKYPIFLYDKQIILSHYPVESTKYFNIHGHIHNKNIEELGYNIEDKSLYYNVSVDTIKFKPILLDSII